MWTKIRIDQIGAADADMPALAETVNRLGRGYKPFGPVLTEALGDHLRKVLGPTGRRQSSIADRVTDVWQLGPGWARSVLAEFALSSRDGASIRGGTFSDHGVIATAADVDAASDSAVGAVAACGIRTFGDDGSIVDNSAPLLASVFPDKDLTFAVTSEAEAFALRDADPAHTHIETGVNGDWKVTRTAGTEIRVPRRIKLSRTVGAQIPTGFDPLVWGIPPDMVDSLDRVAVWNLVCTVDAFLSSGFTPAELMRWIHPSLVANTQGTAMGGMTSMHSLFIDTLLGESKPNDLLQEAMPNIIAAHVVQSYVGGYGPTVNPVAACATTVVSVEEGVDKIRLGKAELAVAAGSSNHKGAARSCSPVVMWRRVWGCRCWESWPGPDRLPPVSIRRFRRRELARSVPHAGGGVPISRDRSGVLA